MTGTRVATGQPSPKSKTANMSKMPFLLSTELVRLLVSIHHLTTGSSSWVVIKPTARTSPTCLFGTPTLTTKKTTKTGSPSVAGLNPPSSSSLSTTTRHATPTSTETSSSQLLLLRSSSWRCSNDLK